MFFLLCGSGGVGKTAVLEVLRGTPRLRVHDQDERGVPDAADTAWRHGNLELWVRQALEHQLAGHDTLVAAQSPFGELLACPSAPELDGIAAALLDCDDAARAARLHLRGHGSDAARDYAGWAAWHRGHARDPGHAPHAIIDGAGPGMRFDRWTGWHRSDARWSVSILDTSALTVQETAVAVRRWMDTARRARDVVRYPLGPPRSSA